ncbi:MAG: hypothetical protein M3280_06765 [Actinomycetota bacterium]|nr:hypothetical protein [Actinomycetota bacterium]
MLLGHPLTEPDRLALSPLFAAVVCVCLVISIEELSKKLPPNREMDPAPDDRFGPLGPRRAAARAVSLIVLLVCIAAGRIGANDQLDNIAPALIVGLAWPLLAVASVVVGRVWAVVDPFDTMARSFRTWTGGDRLDQASDDVSWALPATIAWVWFLSAYPEALDPRSVGTALGLYTIATLAGCLVVGRRTWLDRGEFFGSFYTWVGVLTRGGASRWRAPANSDLVLGALIGGLLFGEVRLSSLWGSLNVRPSATLLATGGVLGFAAAGAALLRLSDPGRRHSAAAALPLAAAVVVAVALARNRMFTSLQLLPALIADPFGFDWNAVGPAPEAIDPAPLGETGLTFLQLGLVLVGGAAGAIVARRRLVEDAWRVVGAVCILTAGAVMALMVV